MIVFLGLQWLSTNWRANSSTAATPEKKYFKLQKWMKMLSISIFDRSPKGCKLTWDEIFLKYTWKEYVNYSEFKWENKNEPILATQESLNAFNGIKQN